MDALLLLFKHNLASIIFVLCRLGIFRLVDLHVAIVTFRLGLNRTTHSHLSRQMVDDPSTTLLLALSPIDSAPLVLVNFL